MRSDCAKCESTIKRSVTKREQKKEKKTKARARARNKIKYKYESNDYVVLHMRVFFRA